MVWQDLPSVDGKEALGPRLRGRLAQQINVIEQRAAAPIGQRESEENVKVVGKGAAIIGNGRRVSDCG